MRKSKGNIAPKMSTVQAVLEDQFSVSYGKHVGAVSPDSGEFQPQVTVSRNKLIKMLTEHRVRRNKEGPYIARPMGGDGTRSDANAQPWQLIPIDIDELPPAEVPMLLKWCAASNLSGILVTTFSHTPEHPKCRLWLFVA